MADNNQVGVKCTICNIYVSSPAEIDQHFSGKKHKKRQFQQSNQEKEEGKSVYVTNLGQLSLSSLQLYFAQYGTICNLNVGWDRQIKDRMHHVIVEFEQEEAVLSILKAPLKFNHKVQYTNQNQMLAAQPRFQLVKVYNREFRARPRSPSPPPCPTFSFEELRMQLSLSFDPEDQINAAVEFTELTQEDIEDRNQMCINISRTFARSGFPGCVVSPFGSTVNGLGFRGCDLDVYIDLGELPWAPSPNNPLMQVPVTMTEVQRVRVAAKLLREIPQCTKIHPITAARVPIVKFVHRMSGIHCDISFKNRASVLNSEFIRFCTEIDSRVRPLMVAVRLFCKRHDLAGGGGGLRISNYALTMLVIYFLQQLEKPVLYTVHTLQQLIGDQKEMINGWNCAFSSDISKLAALPVNKQGILELLCGFFRFYSSLDLSSVVLSPYIGCSMDKSTISTNLPKEFDGLPGFLGEKGLHLDKPMCLQDPFELDHNVCKNLPDKAVIILQAYFKKAGEMAQNLTNPEKPIPGGLNQLFELTVEVPKDPERISNITEIFNRVPGAKIYLGFILPTPENSIQKIRDIVHTVLQDCLKLEKLVGEVEKVPAVDEKVPVKLEKIPGEIEQVSAVEPTTAVEDKEVEINTKECMSSKTEIETTGNCDITLKRKSGEETDSSDEKRTRVEFDLEDLQVELWQVRCHVWAGRRKQGDLLEGQEMSTVQRETTVTERLMLLVPAAILDDKPDIVFKSYVGTIQGRVCVGLEVVHSRKKLFENLFTWLRSYLPDTVKKISSEEK